MLFPIMLEFDYTPGNDTSDPSSIARLFKAREFLNPLKWIVAGQLLQAQRVGMLQSSGTYYLTVSMKRGRFAGRLYRVSS